MTKSEILDRMVTAIENIGKLSTNVLTKHDCRERIDFVHQLDKVYLTALEALKKYNEYEKEKSKENINCIGQVVTQKLLGVRV